MLYLIVGLQLLTIIASRGNMYVLGEAYAFGVVWSFVFKALAMVVLRFKDRSPREFKVPLNIRIRGVEVPIGLSVIFLILLSTAVLNLLTKEVATIGGIDLHRGLPDHLHGLRALPREAARQRRPTSTWSSSTSRRSTRLPPPPWA